MRVETVKKSYEKRPATWNFGMTTIIGGAAIAIAFFVNAELGKHSVSETAHPVITGQLADIKSGQNTIRAELKKAEIMRVDHLICDEPENRYYRDHILTLITEWETITAKEFPQQLLRCASGNP